MNSAHLHLALNHLPVVGSLVALALLAAGLWKRSEDIKRAGLWLLLASAVFALPVYLTGEPAEDIVERLPGVSDQLIEQHESAAGVAVAALAVLGAIAMAGLIAFRGGRKMVPWFAVMVLAGNLVACSLMGWTASIGGKIRHTEIRR